MACSSSVVKLYALSVTHYSAIIERTTSIDA